MKKVVLFGVPAHGNIGDAAITVAEEKFIKDNLSEFEYISVLEDDIEEKVKEFKEILMEEDLILLHGGGNLGDKYISLEEKRRLIIESFPNNKIILMPQTIHFSDTARGKEELEKTKKIYNNHKDLTLVAREKISFEIMKREFTNANVILTPDIVMYLNETKPREKVEQEIVVKEQMDVTQGKLVLGLTIVKNDLDSKYVTLVYNTILGGGANSKLFQNVREKASLAYTAGSNYVRQINNIFVRCGIEISNYEKALEIIKQQLEDIKQGKFSDKDLENAKTNIISTIKFIPDEQDTGITYYFGQELSNNNIDFEEYEKRVRNVTKEQIMELAKGVNIHTIYFLTGKEEK